MADVVMTAGGTGGHVYPALSTARALIEKGFSVSWIGTDAGIEARLVPGEGIDFHSLSVRGLRGKGLRSQFFTLLHLGFAFVRAIILLRGFKPKLVIGLGGYVTGPVGLAAWVLRIPLVIHEQNAIAGLTNRLLSRLASRVLQAYPNTFSGNKVHTTGNPVRKSIVDIKPPEKRFRDREGPLRILVLGGSLGAKSLNDLLPVVLSSLPDVDIWHQTGPKHVDSVQYEGNHKVVPYIDDMGKALGWADVVICRAGALTLTELTVAGVGSILVPYPYAVDDHQTANAEHLVSAKAAILIPESELSTQRLTKTLSPLNRDILYDMANASRSLAKPNATSDVLFHCMEWLT